MTDNNNSTDRTLSGIVNLEDVSGPAPEVQVAADITDEDGSTANLKEKTFEDFGVDERIASALNAEGITHPFPIQALTLPVALGRHDIIGQAKTGTGKTLGFAIPALMSVLGPKDEGFDKLLCPGAPQALIVVPTRELAKQVAQDLRVASKNLSARICEVYGGVGFDAQLDQLERGAEVVVGTPGRLLDLMKRKNLVLSGVRTVVLDEADEMLDLGFLPDVETLLARTPASRHTMLFSATMPGPIITLARGFMHKPVHIRAESAESSQTHASTRQVVMQAHQMDKTAIISRILQAPGRGRTIIFTRTKRSSATLAENLAAHGFAVGAVHGDMGQSARERSLTAFREGRITILVATDVAARGIDIDDVTHVINYQTPDDPMTYVHRIGRTGRAGHTGTAVTLVGFDELHKWALINDELKLDQAEPPQWFSTSPELFEALDIPEGATDSIGDARPVFGGGASSLRGRGSRPRGAGRSHGRGQQSGRGGRGRRN